MEAAVGAVDVLAADHDETPRDSPEGAQGRQRFLLRERSHVHDYIRQELLEGLLVCGQQHPVTVDVCDLFGQVDLGLASMKDRDVVTRLVQAASNRRPNKVRATDDENAHVVAGSSVLNRL